jgi:vacuolar-type H+-ATPase subunit F/Vma7
MRVAALGEQASVQGYGLAGALVLVAEDAEAVRAAWAGLGEDVAVVILTQTAARALGDAVAATLPLTVVLPS